MSFHFLFGMLVLLMQCLVLNTAHAFSWPWERAEPARIEAIQNGEATPSTPKTPAFYVSQTWWEQFGREDLNGLVITSILNNLDLQAQEAQVGAIRQGVKKQFAQELPQVSIGASWVRQKNSANLISPNFREFQGTGPRIFAPGSTFSIFNLPLNVDYELDIFQKNRMATKAERARYHAEALRLRDMELALAEQAVSVGLNTYLNEAQRRIANEKLVLLQELKHLENVQLEAGLTDESAVLNREAQISAQKTQIATLEERQQQLQHEAALLAGQSIRGFQWQSGEPKARTFFESATLEPYQRWLRIESNQLIRRPDVQAQEALLRAAGFDVKVARRMFLPTFSLSASVGLASTELSQWFDWNSVLASFGAQVAQKLFTGGALKANLKQQEVLYNGMTKQYQATLLKAGKATEDALAGLNAALTQQAAHTERLMAMEKMLTNQALLYQNGLAAYPQVLDQQVLLLDQRRETLESKAQVMLAWNHLQRELGGGFVE